MQQDPKEIREKAKLDGQSLNINEERLAQLKTLFPEVFTEGKVDFKLLKQTLDAANLNAPDERYELSWTGKADAFAECQKRTTATLKPEKEESVQFDQSQNLFIEGENLEVLRCLQKSYYGKIKMIYIDPPYNTGNDSFVYPDDYSERKEEYEKRAGIRNKEGYLNKQDLWQKNSKENGQYHSVWLSMMYPRLFLARNLLKDDGVIFVSIDDHEAHNLKLLLDSIFGEENFVGQWNWLKTTTPPSLAHKIKKTIEYVFCYQKTKDSSKFAGVKKKSKSTDPLTKSQNSLKKLTFPPQTLIINQDDTIIEAGVYGTEKYPNELLNDLQVSGNTNANKVTFINKFIWVQDTLMQALEEGTKIFLSKSGVLSYKKAEYSEEVPPSLIDAKVGVSTTETAGTALVEMFDNVKVFDYPKPVSLLKYLLNFSNSENEIILDFFAGSATTAHAVLDMNEEDGGNRKFICVQMPEAIEEDSDAYKEGFRSIADIGRTRIKKVIEQLEQQRTEEAQNPALFEENDGQQQVLGFKSFKLSSSNFKQWNNTVKADTDVQSQLELNQASTKADSDKEAILHELVLKMGYPLTVTIEAQTTEELTWYKVAQGELAIALEGVTPKLIEALQALKPAVFLCLDSLFAENDQLLTNTHLQLKEAGIKMQLV